MRRLLLSAALLASALSSDAAILIYEGPAPVKGYGSAPDPKRSKAYLLIDTASSTVQLINFYSPRGQRDFTVADPITVDNAVIPGLKGSTTVATGTLRTQAQPTDFDSTILSFRGKNRKLDGTGGVVGPRVISGIYRRTTKILSDVSHLEQRFTLKFDERLSSAANTNGETLAQAVQRVATVLENKQFSEVQ